MDARKLTTLILVPLAVAACAEQGGQQEDGGQEAAMDAPAEAAGGAGQVAMQAALSPKNESGITGTVEWTSSADSLSVSVSLEGLTEGQEYPAHVHQGTCASPGGVAAALSPVAGASGGSGSSTATVAKASFEAGQSYLVQAHLPDGTPAACGDLPAGFAGGESGGTEGGEGM